MDENVAISALARHDSWMSVSGEYAHDSPTKSLIAHKHAQIACTYASFSLLSNKKLFQQGQNVVYVRNSLYHEIYYPKYLQENSICVLSSYRYKDSFCTSKKSHPSTFFWSPFFLNHQNWLRVWGWNSFCSEFWPFCFPSSSDLYINTRPPQHVQRQRMRLKTSLSSILGICARPKQFPMFAWQVLLDQSIECGTTATF